MLVKSDFISKHAMKSEASNFKTSLANEKKSFIVYSLLISDFSNWSQSLCSLYVGVPTVDKIGQNDGVPSSSALWILASPYRTRGFVEPDRYKSFFFFQKFYLYLINFWGDTLFVLPYDSSDSKLLLPQYELFQI